jgi:hypothetical protein
MRAWALPQTVETTLRTSSACVPGLHAHLALGICERLLLWPGLVASESLIRSGTENAMQSVDYLLRKNSGLRESEIHGLQWPDYTGEELFVRRAVQRTAINQTKTPESKAVVPVKNETIRNHIVQAQKTWRKHNAAMILATQSIKELEESGMLVIVVESCPTKIFLANPETNREVYKEAFHLNDTELDIIGDLVPPGQMLAWKGTCLEEGAIERRFRLALDGNQ